MSAAAIIAARRRRLIRRFREAGATVLERAVTLEQLRERQTWIFNRMVRAGVFLQAPGGRYYMDEPAAVAYRHSCRVRALWGAAICLAVFGVVYAILQLLGVTGR